MANTKFITIGSKGTSFPRELKKLDPPLQIGANGIAINGINWSRGPCMEVGWQANGWVSEAKKKDPFYIFPLEQALTEARVVHVPRIGWTGRGRHFTGEAFFPKGWSPSDRQPLYVAVRATGWRYGCVSRDWHSRDHDGWVAKFDMTQLSIRPLSKGDPVDIEAEIEHERNSFAHESETTRQAIIQARRGQGPFREKLKRLWSSQCAVTQCTATAILQASHIKPWSEASNCERLDRFNGLLLTPNLHAAFDRGLISFRDDGKILFSSFFSSADAQALGLRSEMRLHRVFRHNKPYLAHHRTRWGFQP